MAARDLLIRSENMINSLQTHCITSIFYLLGNNCLSSEPESLGTLPVLSQQLPDLGSTSKVDLQDISRVGILILDLSLTRQIRMSSNNVHLIQVLSSETRDGWVLHLGSVDVTDNLAFGVVTDDSSVFESSNPDISDSVHCKTVKDSVCGLIVHCLGFLGKDLHVGKVRVFVKVVRNDVALTGINIV